MCFLTEHEAFTHKEHPGLFSVMYHYAMVPTTHTAASEARTRAPQSIFQVRLKVCGLSRTLMNTVKTCGHGKYETLWKSPCFQGRNRENTMDSQGSCQLSSCFSILQAKYASALKAKGAAWRGGSV